MFLMEIETTDIRHECVNLISRNTRAVVDKTPRDDLTSSSLNESSQTGTGVEHKHTFLY